MKQEENKECLLCKDVPKFCIECGRTLDWIEENKSPPKVYIEAAGNMTKDGTQAIIDVCNSEDTPFKNNSPLDKGNNGINSGKSAEEEQIVSSSVPLSPEDTSFNFRGELKKIFETELLGHTNRAGRIYRKLKARDEEFIKRLKEEIEVTKQGFIQLSEPATLKTIDKLAGSKLI